MELGEGEMDAPKERRPAMTADNIHSMLSGNSLDAEDTSSDVDPFYAEYRRQRRRNRGRSLSEPEEGAYRFTAGTLFDTRTGKQVIDDHAPMVSQAPKFTQMEEAKPQTPPHMLHHGMMQMGLAANQSTAGIDRHIVEDDRRSTFSNGAAPGGAVTHVSSRSPYASPGRVRLSNGHSSNGQLDTQLVPVGDMTPVDLYSATRPTADQHSLARPTVLVGDHLQFRAG